MAPISDFRLAALNLGTINNCGKHIGRRAYWRLYIIENLFRIVIHSVLSVQISDDWWSVAVDKNIQRKAKIYSNTYSRKSWYGKIGTHGIYYIDLKDLNEIIRANANLFDPIISDIDRWILGIEETRLPRNLVAHMNFPDEMDIKSIDNFYKDCKKLVDLVQDKVPLKIPS